MQNGAGRGGGFGGFIVELRRRHVVRAGVAYAAVAFVILQAAQIIQEAWEFPEWVLRLVVVFTLLGFPLVLALAWVYEITPMGVRQTSDMEAESGIPESAGLPRIAFLIVTVIVVGVSGWWWVRSTVEEVEGAGAAAGSAARLAARNPGDAIRSLAVLPLESFSQEQGRDFFAEGMQEALISELSQLNFVRVLSRTSSSQIVTQGKTAPQIGHELGVDALIEGSVLTADGRVRITVQLIDVADDRHIWARDYERDLVDIIALQREVADSIAIAVRGELDPDALGITQISETAAPTDPAAAEAMMRGRMALSDLTSGATFASTSLDSAAQHFRNALDSDPDFAPAFRGLAQVYMLRALSGSGAAATDNIAAAVQSATRAMELDPNSRESREVLASVGLLGPQLPDMPGGPFPMDVRMGQDSMGVVMVGDTAKPMVTMTEAGKQMQIALARREANDDSPGTQFRAARRYVSIGMAVEAREVLQQVVRDDPRNFQAWDELEQMHRILGDLGAVVDMWRSRSQAASGSQNQNQSSSAPSERSIRALEEAVRRDSVAGYWRWRLNELQAREERGAPVSLVELADAYAGLGNAEEALTHLERGAARGDPRVRSVRTDPVWDPFRREPRYIAALARADEFGPSGSGTRGGGRGGGGRPPEGQGGRSPEGGRGGGGRGDTGRGGGGSPGAAGPGGEG